MKILVSAKHFLKQLVHNTHQLSSLQDSIEDLKILAAASLVKQVRSADAHGNIRDAEFKVFSQFGDDGIIQYLIANIAICTEHQKFIEFGVENYKESNTRFLLMNDNWTGLILDSSVENINSIKR